MPKRPNSRRNLDIAIERIAGRGQDFVQARTVMADAVVDVYKRQAIGCAKVALRACRYNYM